jgi:hypothetical protein
VCYNIVKKRRRIHSVRLAEWFKATDLRPVRAICVGSNPTPHTFVCIGRFIEERRNPNIKC